MEYIDIHSHLNLEPLSQNKEEILGKMKVLKVGTITVGTGLETSKEAIKIAEENPDSCWATVGIHPREDLSFKNRDHNNEKHEGYDFIGWKEIEKLAEHHKVIAIGETGLDYYHEKSETLKELQTTLFKRHIELAKQVQKPLMLHVRASKGTDDAYEDALEILKGSKIHANFHFFAGSVEMMKKIIKAGYTISVDGPITFIHDYEVMIKECPLESIMVETDAPFAAPAMYRGKTCEPWMVVEVVKKIAEIKGLEVEEVRKQVLENSKKFFGLDI